MPDHRAEQLLDVLGNRVVAARQEGPGAHGAVEREAAAHRRPQLDERELPRRPDHVHDPASQQRIDVHALDGREWESVVDTSGYFPRVVAASASKLAEAAERYVFVSSLSAYSDDRTPGQDESGPLGTIDDPTIEEITDERISRPSRTIAAAVSSHELSMPNTNTFLILIQVTGL